MHQYSRDRAVLAAANHVPPTRRVTVTSCIMRHRMLLRSLRRGKLPFAAFTLFHVRRAAEGIREDTHTHTHTHTRLTALFPGLPG